MISSPRQFLAVFLFTSTLFSITPLSAQESRLASIIHRLDKIDTDAGGYPSTDVPPLAQQLFPELKLALRESIRQSLNSQNVFDPKVLRDLILADLKNQGAALPPPESQSEGTFQPAEFGSLEDVEIQQPTRHPELLAVVVTLAIPCGSDSSLYIYRLDGTGWQLFMVQESNNYTEVSGAQGSFAFAVSPPDEDGKWFVVTANVNPWCTSNWQALRYQVLRPPLSGNQPVEILNETTGIYLGNDKPYSIKIHGHGFTITNSGSQSLDADILVRTHIHRYEVKGNSVERIPPYAVSPEDFLDEWVELKWEEASRWVVSPDMSALSEWHSRLGCNDQSKREFFTEFDFVQPCPSTEAVMRWQIGLNLDGTDEKQLPEGVPDELFFAVTKRQGSFYIESVSTERLPGCPGRGYARRD